MTHLSALGAASCGVWTRHDALTVLRRDQLHWRLERGVWQVVVPGVYADGGFVLTAEQRAVAAVLASGGVVARDERAPGPPRALAAGRTAARLWRLPLVDDDDPATGAAQHRVDDVAVRRSLAGRRWRDREGQERRLERHRLAPLAAGDAVRLASGLWVTAPVRTLVDLASLLTHEALVCALDDALHRRLVSAPALRAAVAARAGRRGGARLRRAVDAADGRAEAPSETLARLLLRPLLPGLVPQVRVRVGGRVAARLDLGDEDLLLGVEMDGRRGHAGEAMIAKDRRRDAPVLGVGWEVERGGWWDVRCDQDAFVRRVLARAGRQRRLLTAR